VSDVDPKIQMSDADLLARMVFDRSPDDPELPMPFLSGSRAYGTPREDSDVDVVMLVNHRLGSMLCAMSDEGPSCRFGKLNLVLFGADSDEGVYLFHDWRKTTEELILRKPVTRDEAIEAFQKAGFKSKDYTVGDESDVQDSIADEQELF
jgi:predicted nucleotidyltransferase